MLQLLKHKLRTNIKVFRKKADNIEGEFHRRIRHRHHTFWSAPDAETIRNTPMGAHEPLSKWKNVENWQRKLSNKYNAREFAMLHGCRVPDLYWRGRDINQLDFSLLPEQYVIRPTIGHSSKLVFLIDKSVNLMDKRVYTVPEIKAALAKAVAKNPHLEFLVEEFIRDEDDIYRIPDDYKISVFNGEIAVIDVINRTSPTTGLSSCYDQNWNRIDNIATYYQQAPLQKPPQCLPEMIAQAKKLGRAYGIFVRIDFYATDKGVVFGEFTPTPSLGKGFTPKANKLFINYWDRFCQGML